jgi:hypothetical protein
MHKLRKLTFAILISILLAILATISFTVPYFFSWIDKNVSGTLGGLFLGGIFTALVYGFRNENEYRIKFEKAFGMYDPAQGFPDYEKDGKRYYNSRAGLPDIGSLFAMETLESVTVLSITSYILLLSHRDDIINASGKEIEFIFLVLDPDDVETVNRQSGNYRERDIKTQIEVTISDLENIVKSGGNRKISIFKYTGMIQHGILILKFKYSDNSWIKVEEFPSLSDATSRPNSTWYRDDNEKEFKIYFNELDNMVKNSKLHNFA